MKFNFTKESIAAHLSACQSMEYEGGDSGTYYLHMTDKQEMLPARSGYGFCADVTFTAERDLTPYIIDEGVDLTRLFYDEALTNEGFASVVDDLYEQAAAYFEALDDLI